jgi:DNA ligase (NAD+)
MSEKIRVYVTGKIQDMTKAEIQKFVESKGFQWSASISNKLDLLIYGERAGPKKIQKAKQLGIKLQSWDEFKATLSEMS